MVTLLRYGLLDKIDFLINKYLLIFLMCIICQKQYSLNISPKDKYKINITDEQCSKLITLDCCISVATIPNTLINLTHLYCYKCINLSSIPDTLINLTTLECQDTNLISIPATLINLIYLYCSGCTSLAIIPDALINITELSCRGCISLAIIPDTFISPKGTRSNLTTLYCHGCTSLISIPYTIISPKGTRSNITTLDCSSCTSLTNIPNTLINITTLDCSDCTRLIQIPSNNFNYINCVNCKWLHHDANKNCYYNIQKLKIISCWFRRNIRFFIFKRWIKSQEGIKWLYDPANIGANIGGKVVKVNINKSISIKAYQ